MATEKECSFVCGIVGFFSLSETIDESTFDQMRDSLAHRGPDDAGSEFFEEHRFALGHRRLSFLDLSSGGRQPMSNEDGSVWLVFNGEIYNYLELRTELEKAGHTFKSTSDSEVIIHGFEEWGPKVVEHLKGMFAFAILDLKNRQLLLARDRFGIKPLYYYNDGRLFVFASEIKAIHRCPAVKLTLSVSSVADYLVYRYVPSPKSIWEEVRKVPPAHTVTVNLEQLSEVRNEYWTIPFGSRRGNRESLVSKVDALLTRSVQEHSRSDVPIGSFLSGGYDSSALVCYMSKLGFRPETFSIGFTQWPESEHQYAECVANHLKVPFHHLIAGSDSLDILDIMPDVYDEPIADISIVPTWMVSNLARTKVKAVFSGEGADELFGGYWWPKKYEEIHRPASWKQKVKRIIRPFRMDDTAFYADAMAMGRFDDGELRKALCDQWHSEIPADPDWFYRSHLNTGLDPLKSIQRLDIKCFMGELVLTKIDRASMANSLEVRVPFLDHELYEGVLRLRNNAYFQPGVAKYPLHQLLKSNVPDQILRREKQGFVGPDSYYMDIDWYKGILKSASLVEADIIRPDYVDGLFETADHWRLWKLAVLEKWHRRWSA